MQLTLSLYASVTNSDATTTSNSLGKESLVHRYRNNNCAIA